MDVCGQTQKKKNKSNKKIKSGGKYNLLSQVWCRSAVLGALLQVVEIKMFYCPYSDRFNNYWPS